MKESVIESTVSRWAKEHGIRTLKLSGPNQKGQPDRAYLKAGKTVFVEYKKPGKTPTALQDKWIEGLREEGFAAEWHDHPGLAIQFLKKEFGIQ